MSILEGEHIVGNADSRALGKTLQEHHKLHVRQEGLWAVTACLCSMSTRPSVFYQHLTIFNFQINMFSKLFIQDIIYSFILQMVSNTKDIWNFSFEIPSISFVLTHKNQLCSFMGSTGV